MITPNKDIGAAIAPKVGTNPKNDTGAAAVNGAAIDRMGFQSATLIAQAGAASGSPTAQTLDAKLQDSADGSTGWADITGAAITQITADNQLAQKDVDLSGAKRYVRVVHTVTLTAGTTPALPVSTSVILGGADTLPTT